MVVYWVSIMDADNTPEAGLERAIAAMGSRYALAKALNLSPQAVNQWRHVPLQRVRDVARLTGIELNELRPDIYGDEAVSP